jgi:hypothetical protein
MIRYRPPIGLIVPFAGSPKRIRLESLYSEIRPIISDLRVMIGESSSEPPPLCLNKYCQLCQFCDHCTKEAEQSDSLSLLGRMTPKLIRKYQKKGIFTITQLSYLYRPRRSKKKSTSVPLSFIGPSRSHSGSFCRNMLTQVLSASSYHNSPRNMQTQKTSFVKAYFRAL